MRERTERDHEQETTRPNGANESPKAEAAHGRSPQQRLETGPVKCGNDWTGVFIRGDSALLGYVPALRAVVQQPGIHPFTLMYLRGLLTLLESCAEGTSTPQRIQLAPSVVSPAAQAESLQAVYDRAVHETSPQWQTIDTAPKDGVLLMWNRTSGVVMGYWLAARSAGSPCWWEVNGFAIYPTHWMPLPDPPAAIRAAASPEREP